MALLLTSSSLARSLIRILLIRPFFAHRSLSLHRNLAESASHPALRLGPQTRPVRFTVLSQQSPLLRSPPALPLPKKRAPPLRWLRLLLDFPFRPLLQRMPLRPRLPGVALPLRPLELPRRRSPDWRSNYLPPK